MNRSRSLITASLVLAAASAAARADISNNFSSNPLTGSGVTIQGPDAANVNARFTYNSAADTLTAHYNSTQPTIKLLFPLGQHLNQNTSFTVTATFEILSSGFVTPPSYAASIPEFGLINSATTGNQRGATTDLSFNTVTDGTAYDLVTFGYFPTQDTDGFGTNSVNLSVIQSAKAGSQFYGRGIFNGSTYSDQNLPFDQFITASMSYNAATEKVAVNFGGVPFVADLTSAPNLAFDVDSFAITLWNDPQYAPTDGSVAWDATDPVSGTVVFDSFSVQSAPEPASLGMLALGSLLLVVRRRRSPC